MGPRTRDLAVFIACNVILLSANGPTLAYNGELDLSVVIGQAPSAATRRASTPDPNAAKEPSPSESEKAALSALVTDSSRPQLVFKNPKDALSWLQEMDNRLRARIPETKQRTDLLTTVHFEATRAGLDSQFVLALIDVQSSFRKYAVSPAGARGYMQVMPFWVDLIGQPQHNLFALRTNLRYGCVILRYFLDLEKGDYQRALERYGGRSMKADFPAKIQESWRMRWAYDGPKS